MNILFVASECAPYIASGGLGDVLGALPKAVKKTDSEQEVSVIIPLYNNIAADYKGMLTKECTIKFFLSWRECVASVYKTENEGVCYYFIDNPYYFSRGRLYGEYDDAERFAFFSMAVVEFILQNNLKIDILHANDWQTAMSIIYLKTLYRHNPALKGIRSLYTVHNIEYQGKFSGENLEDVFGIPREEYGVLEFDGCINLMKGALVVSDYISTVSPNYKEELKHNFFAYGLASVIESVHYKMAGIINGIDYEIFSPDRDNDIYKKYSKKTISEGKRRNKLAFQKEFGLAQDESTPLIVLVTRLTEGKGIDLFLHVAEELLLEKVQIAILGTGDKYYEDALTALDKKHENLVSLIKFDRALSKKMYAAADIFLMPSKTEPCGLSQMIATSYGTVPIVRSVGGLYDTIKNFNGNEGNGFRFDNYNAHDMLYKIKEALSVYNSKKWSALRGRAFDSRFTWENSAKKYIQIYNNLLNW